MVYNVHGGHSLVCRGAAALLDEVIEDRKVKNRVIKLLRAAGHTAYDCTDDAGATQNENLAAIVKKCNAHQAFLDISIHLNSGRNDSTGDGSTGGVEVYGYDAGTQEIGADICSGIAAALNLNNRGFKINTGLYVLRSTKSPAILIECAFVDDKDDADRWDADRCADAIVKALIGSVPSNDTAANHKYAVGQEVSYGTSYKNPTDPCGYEAAVGGSGHGMERLSPSYPDRQSIRSIPECSAMMGISSGCIQHRRRIRQCQMFIIKFMPVEDGIPR